MEKLPIKGDVIASKYVVEGTLGTGGMGAVFEVSHRVTGKRFAIKWLLPTLAAQSEAVGRFMREAQVAGRVDHPNVVEVYDFGQEGESFYIVMELLQGEPLSRRLERLGKLPVDVACRILIPVARGLQAAHTAGVIHRDLKPDNIFLCHAPSNEEAPKVVDFGISKMSSLAGETGTHVTRMGVVMGTPRYMAPEQIRAEPVDPRTDVYALGVILYEMLGGNVPFPGDSYSDLVLRIMTEQPKPLSALAPNTPKAVIDIITKAMARDRNLRFTSVQDFALALEPFDKGTHFAVRTVQPTAHAGDSERRPRDSTPLSTESQQLRLSMDAAEHSRSARAVPRFVVAGVLVAALAVAALGGVAYFKSARGTPTGQKTAPETITETTTTAIRHEAPPAQATHDTQAATAQPSANELPMPNTMRIGAEAQSKPSARAADATASAAPTRNAANTVNTANNDAGLPDKRVQPDSQRELTEAAAVAPQAIRVPRNRKTADPSAVVTGSDQPPAPEETVAPPEPAAEPPSSVSHRTVELGPSDF